MIRAWLARMRHPFGLALLALLAASTGLVVLMTKGSLGSGLSGEEAFLKRGYHAPEGYNKRVTEMLRPGGPLVRSAPRRGEAELFGRLEFDPGRATDQERDFYDQSGRLRRDITQFNETGGGAFHLSRGELRLDPFAHRIPMPYPETGDFTGRLAFDDRPLPTLASGSVILALREPEQEGARAEIQTLAFSQWARRGEIQFLDAAGYQLVGAEGRVLVRLGCTGGKILVEVPQREFAEVSFDEVPLNRGGNEGLFEIQRRNVRLPPNTYQIETGERLRIVSRAGTIVFRAGTYSSGVITQTLVLNGRETRHANPRWIEVFPMAADIEAALQRFAFRKGADVDKPRVARLTIERDLQEVLQGKLEGFIEPYDRSLVARSWVYGDLPARPGAIAVVDADNGRVTAMASYPSPKRWQELYDRKRRGEFGVLSEGHFERLRINQNLRAIPIGSTTKPLLALAIWDRRPALQKLVVEAGRQVDAIYGYRLNKPLSNPSSRTRWDPVEFLQWSSNPYTVHLYFASLAPAESYRLGRTGTLVPDGGAIDVGRYLRGDLIPTGLNHPELDVHAKLREVFDIELVRDFSRPGEEAYDDALLEPLFTAIGAEPGGVPKDFAAVSPEETNLHLQALQSVRGDLISLLIGGGQNRWANVKLAEAYARIGSGRRVRARLLVDPAENDGRIEFEALSVAEKALNLVREGMQKAVLAGTAQRLKPALEALNRDVERLGLRFSCWGKTGTAMRTERFVLREKPRVAMPRECAAFAFYLQVGAVSKGRLWGESAQPLGAVSCTVYLEDRAFNGNSGNAVTLASSFLADLAKFLLEKPAVRKHVLAQRK